VRKVKRNTTYDPADFEYLKEIGGGSLAAGIRIATEAHRGHREYGGG
jgi:hypothetical protein